MSRVFSQMIKKNHVIPNKQCAGLGVIPSLSKGECGGG